MNHFATRARRQTALQNLYQSNQLANESANQYYCRLKALTRAAFHNIDAAAGAQQITARMRQGIRPEIRRILVGRDFDTAEDLRVAIENIEIELATSKDHTAATRDDLKEVVQALKNTIFDQKPKIADIQAIDNGEESQTVAAMSRNIVPRGFPPQIDYRDSRQCF